MATAIYVKTESGDDTLFCLNDNLDEKGIHAFLKEELDEEYAYISELEYCYSE